VPCYGNFRFRADCFGNASDTSIVLDISTTFNASSMTLVSEARNPSNPMWTRFRLSATAAGNPVRLEALINFAPGNPVFKIAVTGEARTNANEVVIPKPPEAIAGGASIGGDQRAVLDVPLANTHGSIALGVDGAGLWMWGGAGFYKRTGAGVALRQSSGNQQPTIENNDGSNRRDIIDTVNGDVRYVRNTVGAWQELTVVTNLWNKTVARCRTVFGGQMVRLQIEAGLAQSVGSGPQTRELTTLPVGHRPSRQRWVYGRLRGTFVNGFKEQIAAEINTNGVIQIRFFDGAAGGDTIAVEAEFLTDT
jgi:hypothetical protein